MHIADAFIQIDFYSYTFFVSMCVPWELNLQPFALLKQCSTTEPQKHNNWSKIILFYGIVVFLIFWVGLCTIYLIIVIII